MSCLWLYRTIRKRISITFSYFQTFNPDVTVSVRQNVRAREDIMKIMDNATDIEELTIDRAYKS